MFLAKRFFKELLPTARDAGSSGGGANRELASEFVKRISYKEDNSTDWEDPEYSLEDIQSGYNIDSYIRQGVDKYVDQIFKEGYTFYGTDERTVEYLNLRLAYIAEASQMPTEELLMGIAEDLVKYGNCMLVKARDDKAEVHPQGVTLTGLYGRKPVAGYFFANPVTMKCRRDDYGTITKWQQDNAKGKQEFDPEDVIHFYYKREKGKAYGTSFLVPVLADVKALRRAEDNVLKMMYRNVFPFHHVKVGSEDVPATNNEIDVTEEAINDMDIEGFGLVTSERVEVKAVASDKVINAEPYIKYLESRVFSGMGIPEIMFGRGDTANRSTGDNMTSEMADRIRAISKIIELFVNNSIIKELLMEGGYDPVLNTEQAVEFRFNDNDVDVEIKKQVHAIYKYEHNSITENEMRSELGKDPIQDADRENMFVELITRQTLKLESQLSAQTATTGTKETNNKEKNGGGRPKSKDIEAVKIGLVKDEIDTLIDNVDKYIEQCYDNNREILQQDILEKIVDCNKEISYIISKDETSFLNDKVLIAMSKNLFDQIHESLIGNNTRYTDKNEMKDLVNINFDLYKKSMVKQLTLRKEDYDND